MEKRNNSDTIKKNDKQTILIVEDYEQLNILLKNALKDTYQIICTHNGIEALQILESQQKPDLIISDIHMEEMDGYEFFTIVSNIHELKDIPFIFLTAKNIKKEKINRISRGTVDFIIKPFSIAELKAKIKSILIQQL
ncbi:MAG: response regulator [Spirochaetales bacterium]|nr:response regulator [Spirochaetales bacterium]